MRRAIGLAMALVVGLAGTCLAGAMYRNDSGAVARAIRIEFSEPAEITSMWPSFPQRDPQGPATVIVLSGGEVPVGGWFRFTWRPDTARVVKIEWLASPGPTFEEIMARIAKYPGPDEPLYEPGPDEAIWLTDLEGHADIYDNDSIMINYAPWFDQSQITRIEVYRNGVRMGFLPEKFDVLTNEQMKTFDGNPLEFSPASSHTDHAIMGYEYRFVLLDTRQPSAPREIARLATAVRSRFVYGSEIAFVTLFKGWPDQINFMTDSELDSYFASLLSIGFTGVTLHVTDFVDWPTHTFFSAHSRQESLSHSDAHDCGDREGSKVGSSRRWLSLY